MKKSTKRVLLWTLALILALLPTLALADSGFTTDGAGNALAEESAASGMTIGGDLYAFGQNVDASSAEIAESAILAGQYISVNNSHIGGSLRAAGYQLSAANTDVDVNATLAGYSISLGNGFSAKAVYGAAQSVNFAGTCDTLWLSAESVVIAGTVNGDVQVDAQSVTVTDTAVITGNLNVTAASEPTVASGASIGNVNFTQSKTEEAAESAAAAASTVGFLAKLGKLLMMIPGRILLAVLYYFIIRKSVDEAAAMVTKRPAAMPVSGLIALISMPIAAVILLCTYIGVPAGMLLLCLYGLAIAFAVSFAACMLGKLFFPKLHTLVAYIIGAAAISIIVIIPYLGGLVKFGCTIYTLGYFIQKIYLGFSKKPASAANDFQTPEQTAVESVNPSASEVL